MLNYNSLCRTLQTSISFKGLLYSYSRSSPLLIACIYITFIYPNIPISHLAAHRPAPWLHAKQTSLHPCRHTVSKPWKHLAASPSSNCLHQPLYTYFIYIHTNVTNMTTYIYIYTYKYIIEVYIYICKHINYTYIYIWFIYVTCSFSCHTLIRVVPYR